MLFLTRLQRLIFGAVVGLCLALSAQIAQSAELEAVSFDPPNGPAFNVIIDGDTQPVTLAEIEGLGMYRATTTTPWEAGSFTFEGPLLGDVLTYLGLADREKIILRAVDGFTAAIPRVDWQDSPVLLATRRDGKLLSRRAQGPTRIVYPETDFPDYAVQEYKSRWIWLIASVETPK